MSKLNTVSIRDAEVVLDAASNTNVFHVRDPHALVQAAGYLKYFHAQEGFNIFLRGQSRLYGTIVPTLYRGLISSRTGRVHTLGVYLKSIQGSQSLFHSFDTRLAEPLLQHYGIKTTWVDLVENVWVALWFSCYRAFAAGPSGKYLHFERRMPRNEAPNNQFAYIVLIGTDIVPVEKSTPGYFRGPNTEVVDLRAAVPSIFLRPHAQHGVLFRLRGNAAGDRQVDYSSTVKGIIRVGLEDALEWLGDGKLVNVHSLFPPPVYDQGYEILLSAPAPTAATIGAIQHIGA